MMTHTALAAAILLCIVTRGEAQSGKADGPTYRAPGGATLKLFLDETNVGSEVTLGEGVGRAQRCRRRGGHRTPLGKAGSGRGRVGVTSPSVAEPERFAGGPAFPFGETTR